MTRLPSTQIDVEASWQTLETEDGHKQWHNGLGIWKSVDDLNRYRAAIAITCPEIIVETGTRWGGSAAWLADEFGVEVVTVDVERTEGRPDSYHRVTYLIGDSTSVSVVQQVRKLVEGKRTMVSLDSDHSAPHVEREIATYGPMVTPGCHLVVEDGLADLLDAQRARRLGARIPRVGGPLLAIATTLAGRHGWHRDLDIEDMSRVSHSPAGWWLRTE